jgi:SWI/SNF-related matrix-associated actin-dependent regulator 1 of chromatin subfamily A
MFYVKRYCEAKSFFKTLKNGRKKKIWLTNGASNLDELNRRTRNLFLRRMKTDIDDMPDKIITPVYHEMTVDEQRDYERLWEEYLVERKKKKKKGEPERELVELILLRQYIAKITVPKTIEMVENALEQDQKVIIFTNFTEELQLLQSHFGSLSVVHYGEMTDKMKQKSVDEFQQNPNKKVFIGNIKSAGVGITLTEATIVIFNSFDWVPGNNEQAEDRSYRIGQTNHVNVYYQLFDDTIAIKMWDILANKKDVISRIINGAEQNEVDDDEMVALLMDELLEEL